MSSLVLVAELESMKGEKRNVTSLWRRESSEKKSERKETGKVTFMEQRRADTSSPRLRCTTEVSR